MTNLEKRRLDVPHNERRIQPEDPIATPSQHGIAARIRGCLPAVIPAIDLNHEPHRWREKISDEATEQRHLTAKHNAQPPPTNARPN